MNSSSYSTSSFHNNGMESEILGSNLFLIILIQQLEVGGFKPLMSPLETSEAINQLNYKALGEILSSNIKSQWVHSYVIIQFYLILSKNYSTRPKKKTWIQSIH